MKKIIIPIMKKVGERAAHVPIKVRSWPHLANQPKMPDSMRTKMEVHNNK